jgi:hypothetical protein
METGFKLIKRVLWIFVLVTGVIFLSGSKLPDKEKPKELQVKNTVTTQTLSGQWRLVTDPENKGRDEGWFNNIRSESKEAVVPGVIQQVFPAYHGVAWYWHSFIPDFRWTSGDRVLIRFGAVDYLADVWINGQHAGTFEGGETPFEFDVTGFLKVQGTNLLAVRVLNPSDKPIDGYVLKEIPHRNKVMVPRSGSPFNSGGIMYPVELRLVPTTYITDVYVRPDIKTGIIGVTVTVRNAGPSATKGTLDLEVSPASGGDILQVVDKQADLPAGMSEHELTIKVSQPRLWSLDDPFLYRIKANLTSESKQSHQQSVRCGFRDFRIVDGYFYLNGKRVFVKCAHTGNCMPVGQQVSVVNDFGRRDMLYAKASGFNTVRFISGVAYPEQLDLCDELGLMVYEECFAGWCLENSPKMAERFDHNTSCMVLRDRNHPSVTMWGLLNETREGPVFQHAVTFLPKVRELDPTRLVLLNSGRFDQEFAIGSASNPGSNEWQHLWGIEGPNVSKIEGNLDHPSNEGAGDFHNYPQVPQSQKTNRYMRELGKNSKPVFLSEYGISSQSSVINELRHLEQTGERSDLEDIVWYHSQSKAFAADWKRLGFDNVYPFPEDMLNESLRLNAQQRTLGFNCIRSNPQICGYNLTGMLDHALTGEGPWTLFREWKPSHFDAIRDGWSTLRWCLFVEPFHAYSGRTVTVEAVLANEDVLKPGEYRAKFRVFGPDGPVWEKESMVKVPNPPMLAVPTIRDTFELKGPAGQYTFAANLEEGGAPTGGKLTFYVSDPATFPQFKGKVSLWGIDKKAEEWLTTHGLVCQQLTTGISKQSEVIIVGKPADSESNPQMWESLSNRLAKGSTVVFLSGQIFLKGSAGIAWLPLKNKGTCRTIHDGCYNKECVSKRHQVFDGLQGPGLMDWNYYGQVIPHEIFEGQDTPDETIAASFATGNPSYQNSYGSGLLIARYRVAEGQLILSTPYILENLDSCPAADRLLLNLMRYAQELSLPKKK